MAFKGGIHPDYNKITANKQIQIANLPKKIVLPMLQSVGAPCEPLVSVGDYVKTGQKIAESTQPCSAPVHSSISGTVKSIEMLPHPITGKPVKSIVIESDGKDEQIDMPKRDYHGLDEDQLRAIINEAGIVGLGGAAFPTHIKLSPPYEKHVDTLIINGAECEPYLTTDHRLMLEKADELIEGIEIMRKILGIKKVYIGIEKNKQDAIDIVKEKSAKRRIRIRALKTQYPQGGEKMLIYSITGRKVPAGGLPMDSRCVVQNVGTAIAVYEAVALSKPLYERVITVTGRVNEPKNLLVRIGTSMKDAIDEAAGYKGRPKKLINGGPMMGFAMPTDDLPVIKCTSGLLVMGESDIRKRTKIECIRCGRCVQACPMQLHPLLIAKYAEKGKIEEAERVYAMDCFECGCCAYVCPSSIPLVHWIRYAKSEITKKRCKK